MNWLIKLLGGYTEDEYNALYCFKKAEVRYLNRELKKTRKNSYRDEKGRFTKAPIDD